LRKAQLSVRKLAQWVEMYAKILTAKIQEQLNLSWRWKFFHSLSSFIYHLSKTHEVPYKITYKTGYLFIYNTFTVQWKVQILASNLLLTSTEIVRTDLLLRQKARQNRQFIAEMFLLFLEFFGWRTLIMTDENNQIKFFL